MSFNAVPTVANGDSWSAAQHNTYLKDNMAALWPGTTAGDLDYYSAANAKTRLAKPSVTSLLQNSSAGVPSWVRSIVSMIGAIHDFAMVESTTEFITTSTTGEDITGMSTTLTLTHFCDILLIASGSIAATGGSDQAILIPSIAGVHHTLNASCPRTYFTQYSPVSVTWARLNTGGGTHTIKLRLASAGGANAYFIGGTLIAVAMVSS